MKYITKIPAKLAPGTVLVHNHVRPQAELGLQGFRAWTEAFNPTRHVLCRCHWAGVDLHGLKHYRINRH